jgi:hypothetical protein
MPMFQTNFFASIFLQNAGNHLPRYIARYTTNTVTSNAGNHLPRYTARYTTNTITSNLIAIKTSNFVKNPQDFKKQDTESLHAGIDRHRDTKILNSFPLYSLSFFCDIPVLIFTNYSLQRECTCSWWLCTLHWSWQSSSMNTNVLMHK